MGRQTQLKRKPPNRRINEERMNKNYNKPSYEKRGLYVEVRGNDVARALRKLKKLVNAEGLVKDKRKKEFYEKPSAVKKHEKAQLF